MTSPVILLYISNGYVGKSLMVDKKKTVKYLSTQNNMGIRCAKLRSSLVKIISVRLSGQAIKFFMVYMLNWQRSKLRFYFISF